MGFEMFDKVYIKDKNVSGRVMESYVDDSGRVVYTVESDKRGYTNDPDAYPGAYPLYDCTEERLVRIDNPPQNRSAKDSGRGRRQKE